jgi:HlyD family secretion protein
MRRMSRFGRMVAPVMLASLVACRGGGPKDRILVSGNIELTEVKAAFKIPGRLIELHAEEGTAVMRGMVLARLDPEQIRRTRCRDQAGLQAAQSQLAQMRTAVEFQRSSLAAEVELRTANVRQAEARLRELLAGSRSQEIQQARALVEEVTAQHEQAAADWDRGQRLYHNDDISRSQFDQFKSRYESSAAAVKRAEENLKLVTEGPRAEQIDSARAQLEQARAGLKMSEALHLELKRKEQEVQSRKAELERARAQVAIVDSQLDDTVVTSPVTGVVLVKSADPGEVLAAGTTFASIGDIDHPWLRAYINEKDLGRVKHGMKARISTDSFPGRVYWGKVSFISSEAEFTPKQIQTAEERVKLVYRIKIDVSNPQHELKSNMPADAEILLSE